MKYKWIISAEDVSVLKDFVDRHKENNFVKGRILRNISGRYPTFSKSEFWKWMVACLLTTQQRAGPHSHISKFLNTSPFPLHYNLCKTFSNLEVSSLDILKNFGGIRRTSKISDELAYNYNWLENKNGWSDVINMAEDLTQQRINRPNPEDIVIERMACLVVQALKGIGPKQSRNLWQSIGLLRFEIPLDSRIIKWLNKNNFPFILSASGLSDENYYQLVMDGIQCWCAKSDIIPCILDAAIFSSYDEDWPEDNNLW